MFSRSSSKCVFVFSALLIVILIAIKLNQDVVVYEIRSLKCETFAEDHQSISVPMDDKLLDLPIKFRLLMQPARKLFCNDTDVQLIVFVHSKLDHFDARKEIRQTWGSRKLQSKLNYRLVFLIGLAEKQHIKIEKQIQNEFKLNDDLVRGNFVDTYRNLIYKHVMGYKWILSSCSTAPKMIMKTDDDAFINIFEIIDLLNIKVENDLLKKSLANEHLLKNQVEIRDLNLAESSLYESSRHSLSNQKHLVKNLIDSNRKFIACSLFPNGTKTKRAGKWKLTKEEYDLDYLPAYCSGITYFLNLNALHSIYKQANEMKRILFIDDLFLTGIVVQRLQQNEKQQSNYLNDYNLNTGNRKRASKLDDLKKNEDDKDLRIVDWSEFYNYSWKEFIRALVEKDKSGNSLAFINDLDKMPNRKELIKIAWKRMENHYKIS